MIFLGNNFSRQDEISQDLSLYEIADQTASTLQTQMDSFSNANISINNEISFNCHRNTIYSESI